MNIFLEQLGKDPLNKFFQEYPPSFDLRALSPINPIGITSRGATRLLGDNVGPLSTWTKINKSHSLVLPQIPSIMGEHGYQRRGPTRLIADK